MLYDVLTPPGDITGSAGAISGGCEFMTFPFVGPGMQASHILAVESKRGSVKGHLGPGPGHAQAPFLEVLAFKGKTKSFPGRTRCFSLMLLWLIETPHSYFLLKDHEHSHK